MARAEKADIEAQFERAQAAVESEYQVSAATKWAYLAAYFSCNVALTLYNKMILGRVRAIYVLSMLTAWYICRGSALPGSALQGDLPSAAHSA